MTNPSPNDIEAVLNCVDVTGIEDCLQELRGMFPTSSITVTFGLSKRNERYVEIRTPCKERWTKVVTGPTFSDAMARVRCLETEVEVR